MTLDVYCGSQLTIIDSKGLILTEMGLFEYSQKLIWTITIKCTIISKQIQKDLVMILIGGSTGNDDYWNSDINFDRHRDRCRAFSHHLDDQEAL